MLEKISKINTKQVNDQQGNKTSRPRISNDDLLIESDPPPIFVCPSAKSVFYIFKQLEKEKTIFHNMWKWHEIQILLELSHAHS